MSVMEKIEMKEIDLILWIITSGFVINFILIFIIWISLIEKIERMNISLREKINSMFLKY
jgi:hypothetical protein